MAKKKRSRPETSLRPGEPALAAAGTSAAMGGAQPAASAAAAGKSRAGAGESSLPLEVAGGGIVAILALMMFLAPALGVPNEEMLQDTLKSIVVSFLALAGGLLLAWQLRKRREPLRWHFVMALPLLLLAYALASMGWSHTYLAGVEAVRWFIFSLIVWVGLNTLSRDRVPMLALGIHLGAVTAALWTALQFWVDFKYFPQGPNPASTFVNRNFFAEFVVCTLPFSALLLARARKSATIALLALSTGFVITTIFMTGTRSALVAMWLQLLVVLPLIAWRCRRQLAMGSWDRKTQLLAAGVLLATVAGLGTIPTGNTKVADEGRGTFALERGFKRTGSISTGDASLGVRMIMWKATANVIEKRPLSGVGAGAWESDIPLYQADGAQLETDYYVHNEFLQLLAEYGLAGWIFLLLLLGWLVVSAWRTWRIRDASAQEEVAVRAVALTSLMALMIVCNVGFPWRMAATGALFALSLSIVAASDARLGLAGRWAAARLPWKPAFSSAFGVAMLAALALAAYITQQAADSEQKIVRATKIALTISASNQFNSPRWNKSKTEMLELIREGVAINPHYRKITPMVADELARWGDWKNATWIWESVLSSRPYVVAILTNAARGHAITGDKEGAAVFLQRAKKIQPRAPAVRSLEVILLLNAGNNAGALKAAREAIQDESFDYDLLTNGFALASGAGDFALAEKATQYRVRDFPDRRAQAWQELGNMYAGPGKDPVKAVAAYRQALEATPPAGRNDYLQQIPPAYRAQLVAGPSSPAAGTQTSASSK